MKIISADNLDRECHRGDQDLIADNIRDAAVAVIICDALNALMDDAQGPSDDKRIYKVVPDDYKLREFKP